VPLLGEATHLPEILSVVFIWLLAKPSPEPQRSSNPLPGGLRAVRDDEDDTRQIG